MMSKEACSSEVAHNVVRSRTAKAPCRCEERNCRSRDWVSCWLPNDRLTLTRRGERMQMSSCDDALFCVFNAECGGLLSALSTVHVRMSPSTISVNGEIDQIPSCLWSLEVNSQVPRLDLKFWWRPYPLTSTSQTSFLSFPGFCRLRSTTRQPRPPPVVVCVCPGSRSRPTPASLFAPKIGKTEGSRTS